MASSDRLCIFESITSAHISLQFILISPSTAYNHLNGQKGRRVAIQAQAETETQIDVY